METEGDAVGGQQQQQQQQPRSYGPFHRLQSPTQSNEVAELQVQSQEIWGRPRRGSDIPQVQAYVGPLPADEQGVEFETNVAPDKNLPPGHARWTGPREGVIIKDNFARIAVVITKNTQSTSQAATESTAEEDYVLVA